MTTILEETVEVTLSYASAKRFNELGYEFPKEWVRQRKKVRVAVKHLQPKSNAKVTRICSKCEAHHLMTFHKARLSPRCHSCITSSDGFKSNVSKAVHKSRVKRGDRANYRTVYRLTHGEPPVGWDVHHINMNHSDNHPDNLIAVPKNVHRNLHANWNKLCSTLFSLNLVKFDRTKLEYSFTEKFVDLFGLETTGPEVFVLTGCFGSGKTTIAEKVKTYFQVLDLDHGDTVADVGKFGNSSKVLYQCAMHAVKTIREMRGLYKNTRVVVVLETPAVVANRITARGGKVNTKSVVRRCERMKKIAEKYADFSGTADECLDYVYRQGTKDLPK